jgi:predicted flap endonuclease-1-like 5' DNA nuclease
MENLLQYCIKVSYICADSDHSKLNFIAEVIFMATIKDIKGVGDVSTAKLLELGIKHVKDLLDKGSQPKGRTELGQSTSVPTSTVLKWVNYADLFRIKGIGGHYAELLEAAGVDSVPELSHRKPENLLAKLEETNTEQKLVRQLPALKVVRKWVDQAKLLPKVVFH